VLTASTEQILFDYPYFSLLGSVSSRAFFVVLSSSYHVPGLVYRRQQIRLLGR